MSIIKTNINNIESNFAKFDLALICEEKYKTLKHLDMIVYTMLKNQETLSISSVKKGNKKYVDSNGYVFVSISQAKLCKILKTTRPTLKASLDRLEKCELIEVTKMGAMECNRIYVGNAESTTTLGEYVTKIGIELDEEMDQTEEKVPSIKVSNINKKADTPQQVSTSKNNSNSSKNISNNSINKNNTNMQEKNNKITKFKPKTRFHNVNHTYDNYTEDELEKLLLENNKKKFR